MPIALHGYSPEYVSGPILIENLTFNGKKFKSAEEAGVQISGGIRDFTFR